MNKVMKRILILIFVFILAGSAFLFLNRREKKEEIYTTMEAGTLPVLSMEIGGVELNYLHGYTKAMDLSSVRDTITPLEENRNIRIFVHYETPGLSRLKYEIRSLDGSQLMEQSEVQLEAVEGRGLSAVLPIQNLISEDIEYSLTISLDGENGAAIYYYTRILWPKNTQYMEMISFAQTFSRNTFDEEAAKDLIPYLEVNNQADNSSLAAVNIQSNLQQITWNSLPVERLQEPKIHITELGEGISTMVLNYQVVLLEEGKEPEVFDISESFSMKKTPDRIYLMGYERSMSQIFEAAADTIIDKKILLGINHVENLDVSFSPDGKYVAFVSGKALWSYHAASNRGTRIFTFRDGSEDIRSNYNQYDIKVISIDDAGNTNFMVFGYMNRGRHEGEVGISFYQYEAEKNMLEERFYIPTNKSHQIVKKEMSSLSYVNDKQLCYFRLNNSIYAIDLTGREYIVVAENFTNDGFMASGDRNRIAWMKVNPATGSSEIEIMNLEEGIKQTIIADEGEALKVLGFVDEDFIYGVARNSDIEKGNGKIPMYAIEILGDNQAVQSRYEKEGVYITNVTVLDTSIKLERASYDETGVLTAIIEDTLIRNEEVRSSEKQGLVSERTGSKKRTYYISLKDTIPQGKELTVSVPGKIMKTEENNQISLPDTQKTKAVFYAYSFGTLKGIYGNATEAIQSVYSEMGTVVDHNQQIVWWRTKKAVYKTINYDNKIVYIEDNNGVDLLSNAYPDKTIISLEGCTLNQVLNFVSGGKPVLAMGKGNEVYVIIGYDQYNITIINLNTKMSSKMGLNDGNAYFTAAGDLYYSYMD